MPYFDFAEIKANFPISKVVDMLGLKLTASGKSLRGKCPVCESSGERNLVVTPDKMVYFCFGDGKGGDALQLISHIKGLDVKSSAEWLQGSAKQNPVKGDTSKEKATKGEPPTEGFAPLTYLEPDHPAVQALGIEPEDAERLGCGYAPRGMMKGTVAFPIRSTTGKLLGYLGTADCKLPATWKF